ncbi:MAG: CBU_0592 family membrane protein [Calditrichia bacterium]
MSYTWHDVAGNIGVVLILASYLLLQLDKVRSEALSYSLSNAIGAGLILLSLYYEFNLSAFFVEVFWVLISLIGIIKALRKKRTPKER